MIMLRVYSLSLVFLLIDVAVIVSTQTTDCLLDDIPDSTAITSNGLQTLVDSAPESTGNEVVTITNGPFYACQVQGTIKGTVQELSAIVEYTLDSDPTTLRTRQFELQCQNANSGDIADNGWDTVTGSPLTTPSFSYRNIDFPQLKSCSSCDRNAGNDYQHCVACNTDCNVGLMRCFGSASIECCVAFEDDSDETCRPDLNCNKNNFVANEQNDFTCACGLNSTSCDPGFEFTNDTDCSCVLSDICLTEPPPCENGGSCILNSAPDSFTCNCTTGFMGTNCSESIPISSSSTLVLVPPTLSSIITSSLEIPSTESLPITSEKQEITLAASTSGSDSFSTMSTNIVIASPSNKPVERKPLFVSAVVVSIIIGLLMLIALIVTVVYLVYSRVAIVKFEQLIKSENAKDSIWLNKGSQAHNNPLYINPEEVTAE